MQEIIKITENNGKSVVSARELYGFLESKERFSKWFDRMKEYGFENGIDYTPYQMVHPQNNQEQTDYALTLDTAKEISMIQRNDKGRQARRYFIECEKRLRDSVPAILERVVSERNQLLQQRQRIDQRISKLNIITNHLQDNNIPSDEERKVFDFLSENINTWIKAGYVKASEFRAMYAAYGGDIGIKKLYRITSEWCKNNGHIFIKSKTMRLGTRTPRVHLFY